MASVAESECHKDPNFAVICSFLDKYGEILGLPQVSYSELEIYLEDTTSTVSKVLVDIHVRLLRRIGRSSVQSDRFEKSIIKFCHHFSEFDAWEVESYGYKHANLKTKLRILKNLLECQFDFNIKFKEKVNESEAESMRFLPIGRDKEGQAYWYFLDKDLNLLVYKEEQDDDDADTWQLVCSDRKQLSNLVNVLQSGGTDVKEEDKTSAESQSSKEGSPVPAMDDGSVKDEQKVPAVLGKNEDRVISKQEAGVTEAPVEKIKDTVKVESPDDMKAENVSISMLGSKKIKIELDAKEVEKTLIKKMPNGDERNEKLNSNEKEPEVQSTDASSLCLKSSDCKENPHTNVTAVPPDDGMEDSRLKKNKENASAHLCDDQEVLKSGSSLTKAGKEDVSVSEVETKKSVQSVKCDENISSEHTEGAVEASRIRSPVNDSSTAKCTGKNEKENVKGCKETESDVNKDKNDTDLSKGGPDTTKERSGRNKTVKKDVSSSVPKEKVSDDVGHAKIKDPSCSSSAEATETNKIIKDPDKDTSGLSEKSSVIASETKDKDSSGSLGEADLDKQVVPSHSNVSVADGEEMENDDDFEDDDDFGSEPSKDPVKLTPSADAEKGDVENANKLTQESDTSTPKVCEKRPSEDGIKEGNSVEETTVIASASDTRPKSDDKSVTEQVDVTSFDDTTYRSDSESQNVQLKTDRGCEGKTVVESKDLKGECVQVDCVKVSGDTNNEAGEKMNVKEIGQEKTSEMRSEEQEKKLPDEQKPENDEDREERKNEVSKHEFERKSVREDAETVASLDKSDGETTKLDRDSDNQAVTGNVVKDAAVENEKESDCQEENKVEGPVEKDGNATSKEKQSSEDVDSKSKTDSTTDVNNEQTESSAKVSTSPTCENNEVRNDKENSSSKDGDSIPKNEMEKSSSVEPEEKEAGKSEQKEEAGKSEQKEEAGKSEQKEEAGKFESKEAGKSESKEEAGNSESKEARKSESKEEAGNSESKEAGKSESKEAGKSESKDDGNSESNEAGKSESKEAGKSESKEDGKSESKEAGKSESKEAGKSESKEDGKSESKEAGKSEQKEEAGKSESKEDGKSESKEDGKSESKKAGKSESKEEAGKSESKEAGKSESKEDGKSESKKDGKSESKKDGKSESKEDGKSKSNEVEKSEQKEEVEKSESKNETEKSESKEGAGNSESKDETAKSKSKGEAGQSESKEKAKDPEASNKTGKCESEGNADESQAEDLVEKSISKGERKSRESKGAEVSVVADKTDQIELRDKAENVGTKNKGAEVSVVADETDQIELRDKAENVGTKNKGDERSTAKDEADKPEGKDTVENISVSKGEVENLDTTDKAKIADTKDISETSDTKDKAERSDTKDLSEKSTKDKAEKSDAKDISEKSDTKDKAKKSDSNDKAENSDATDKAEKAVSKDKADKSASNDKAEKLESNDGAKKSDSNDEAEKSVSKDKAEKIDSKDKAEKPECDMEVDLSESKGKANKSESKEKTDMSEAEEKSEPQTGEGSTASKNKKAVVNENKEEKNVKGRKRKGKEKDIVNKEEEEKEPKNDANEKPVGGSEVHRKLKRGAPEPDSDDTKDSEPNGKRARQIAKVQKTRGGRNAAARGLAARVPRKDSESDDSEPVSQPVAASGGRGRGRRGRGGGGGRDGVKLGGAATKKKTSEQDGEDGEEEASDQTNAKRALKKKPDSSSEALSEEEVTPAKKGRSQIQNNGNAIKVATSATKGRGQKGGKAGGTGAGKGSANKKQPATASVTEADQPSCRRSARVMELRSRRPPTPDTPEEESEATEVDDEENVEGERFKDNDYLHDSLSPEEESGDEEFLPKGRNFQRQAARTIKEENEEAPNEDTPCVKCGKYNHPEMILLCDKCDAGYHTACLRPPLMVIPDGDWFCPPCEHCMLVDKLMVCLQTLDTALKKKNRLVKRQERLAYVGISINNILYKDRPVAVSEKYMQNEGTEDVKIEANGTKEEEQEEEQKNGSGSSTYESEQEEPQHKFRSERLAMRQAQKQSRQLKHKRKKASRAQSSDSEVFAKRTCRTRGAVSYQFKEFDELISNAIDDDQPIRKEKPPGRSRGKDMSNILGASDEEDEKIRQRDGTEIIPMPVVKRKPRRRLTMLESDEEDNSEDESEEFKLSEEDSEATEVEGSDDDQDVEEEELNSGSSDSGDWKPKKTWFNKSNVSGGRRRNRLIDDDEEEEYDSDENASKRRSTRNSRKGRVNYDDFESEAETEEETEEEEASFSDLSSEDSQFARKMKKEKEKRQKKAEAAASVKSPKKGKKKRGADEEETEESVSDSSISRKRKILSEQVNKRRKDGTDSDEPGGVSRGKKKKGGRIKIKVKKPKKKKEYSDDDTVTSSEDDASSDETWAPKSRKRGIGSCDELSEEEKLVEEKAAKEKTSSVVEESQEDDEKDGTKKVVEKDDAVVGDDIADKETPTGIPPRAVIVNTQPVVLIENTLPANIHHQVDENITSPPSSKRRGRRAGAGTNQSVSKGKKRGEITATDNAGQDVNDAKDEPVPGKMRRVSGEGGDEMVENKSQDAAAPPASRCGRLASGEGYGDIFSTPDKKSPVAGQRRGSAEKVKRVGKKKKIPNFLDVPSGGEESEDNEVTSSATNVKKEPSGVLPSNLPMSSPSSTPQESLPVPASEGTAPPHFPGAQNMPHMYNQPYPGGPQFQRGPHPYPPMYMHGGPRPSPPHQPPHQSPNPQNMGTPSCPSVTQGPLNYSSGPQSGLPMTTCGPPPASVESSASVRGPHPYPPGYNTVGPPMGQGMASHQNLEPGQIPPGMSMSRPMNPSYPMGSHDPRQLPPHQQQHPPHHSHSQPWGDMRGQMPPGDPNAHFPHYRGVGPPPLRKTFPQHPYYNIRPPPGMGQYMPGMRPPHPTQPMMNNPLTSMGQMARNLSPTASASSPPLTKNTGESSDDGKAATGPAPIGSPPRQDAPGIHVKVETEDKGSEMRGKDAPTSGTEKPGKPGKKQKGKIKSEKGGGSGLEGEKEVGQKQSDSQPGQPPNIPGDQTDSIQHPQAHYPPHPYAAGPHQGHQFMPHHYRMPYMGGPMVQGMSHPPGGYPYGGPPPSTTGQHHHRPLPQQGAIGAQSPPSGPTTQPQMPAVPQRGRPPLHQATNMTSAQMHAQQHPPLPPSSSSSSSTASPSTTGQYYMSSSSNPGSLTTNQHRGPGRPPKYLSKQPPQPQQQPQQQQPELGQQQQGNFHHLEKQSSLESNPSTADKPTDTPVKEEPKADSTHPSSQPSDASVPPPSSSSSVGGTAAIPTKPNPSVPYQQTSSDGALPPNMSPNRHSHGGPPHSSANFPPHPHAPPGSPYYSGGQYYGHPSPYGHIPPSGHHPHPQHPPPGMPHPPHTNWGQPMGPYDARFRPPMPHGYPQYPMNSDSSTTTTNIPPPSGAQQQQQSNPIHPHATPPHTGVPNTPPRVMAGPQQDFHVAPPGDKPAVIGDRRRSSSTDSRPPSTTTNDNSDTALVKSEPQQQQPEDSHVEKETTESKGEIASSSSSSSSVTVTTVSSSSTSSTISTAAIKEERRSSATSPETSTPATATTTTASTPPPSSSSAVTPSTPTPSIPPSQPAGQSPMRGPGPNTTWSGPNMGPQFQHPMSQIAPYSTMPPYGHHPGMMGPHGPFMMGHGDNPGHQGPHMNQGHYFPPPPGHQYPVPPPHMNRGYNYCPPYMTPGMDPMTLPPGQGFAAEMQGLPPPPQLSKDGSIPRSNGAGDTQQTQPPPHHPAEPHGGGEVGGTSSAPKAKRAKTQKKKESGGGSPNAPRGKSARGGWGGGGGRGGFMIDSLLQSRGAGADGGREEGGEGEEGAPDMKDIMSYVANDEYFKEQTSS